MRSVAWNIFAAVQDKKIWSKEESVKCKMDKNNAKDKALLSKITLTSEK